MAQVQQSILINENEGGGTNKSVQEGSMGKEVSNALEESNVPKFESSEVELFSMLYSKHNNDLHSFQLPCSTNKNLVDFESIDTNP